ncbi:cupin domain-containing protein [Caenimonas soli]|jgi:quercetin dioxygenase-like cupin family protein|uniref:cupin domain-containing protein n=1 Tax=Caenimonas soli TaxID=2735555 RepID=UPI001552BE14|nr:cupin domain-containing protein [Caenimonas soli]NPC54570.1 cupin domain-containing protein [Caenimonas soli]
MHTILPRAAAILLLLANWAIPAFAQQPGLARPSQVLSEMVEQMPRGERQQVRVLTAAFQPGERTVFHTHRSPVTVYVLEGQFTLELEGRPPIVVGPGQAYVEPPHVKMTGYNRSSSEPLKVVIFYVSDPGTPFLDSVH